MMLEKNKIFRSILESKDGVHLTIYLVNRGDLVDLKNQLLDSIDDALDSLMSVQTESERQKFLEPLTLLLTDARILKQIKGNIAIFRSRDYFRILNIPIKLDRQCHVANSFHVKPLLRWLQGDQDFLLLGLNNKSAHLYAGSLNKLTTIASIQIEQLASSISTKDYNFNLNQKSLSEAAITDLIFWVSENISELTKKLKPKLFLAGNPYDLKAFLKHFKYKNTVLAPVFSSFDTKNVGIICNNIRAKIRHESRENLEKILREFRFAEQENRVQKNLFQISKAVVRGKVRKLIVTDELNIFGKIDPKSGGLAIHPFDLDHEDDCILDDLAQLVLSQGGEVVIAKRDEIPKGRPILAILEDSGEREKELNFNDETREDYL